VVVEGLKALASAPCEIMSVCLLPRFGQSISESSKKINIAVTPVILGVHIISTISTLLKFHALNSSRLRNMLSAYTLLDSIGDRRVVGAGTLMPLNTLPSVSASSCGRGTQ
jgi:hypothetical protein